MSSFAIGDFEFINLSRAISRPAEGVSLEVKPGVDGTTVWQNGRRGEPFQLVSSVNAADIASADDLLVAYQALKGQNPVLVKWANRVLACKVMVLDVQPIDGEMFATLTSVGGIFAAGTSTAAFLRAVWTLLSLDP